MKNLNFFLNAGELSEPPEISIQQMYQQICSNIKNSSTMIFITTDA